LRGYVVWHGGRDLFIIGAFEMKDYAVAFIAAVCIVAFVIFGTYIIAWAGWG